MAKSIKIKGDSLILKVTTLGHLFFESLSLVESQVLSELIRMSDGSGLSVSAETGREIRRVLNLKDSSFNVAMHRLVKKGTIKKEGSRITLHPVLNNIFNENEFVLRFTPLA